MALPQILYRDKSTYCSRWGLQIAANMALDWEPGEWYALVWGANQDLPQDYSARYRLLNYLVHRRIILNAALLTDEQTIWFVGQLQQYKPRIIYASREFGVVADQCPNSDLLRVIPGTIKIEILPISPEDPQLGEMVITDLLNVGMPFIRYRTGDIVRLTEGEVNGRPGLFLSEIAGRTTDLIVSPNGRIISGTALTPSFFTAHPGIKQAQIHQIEPDKFHILIVRNNDYPMDEAERKIAATLGEYCGAPVTAKVE